jgi:hypothetical protein
MPINDKVKVADYNDIRNKVIGVLGPGSGNTGYGQAIRSSAVSISTKVGVNDWANLYYDIYNSYVHQTGSAPPAPGSIVENELVRYNAAKPNFQYDTYANTLVASRFTVAGSQSATTSKGSASTPWPGAYGAYWNTLAQCTVTVSFTSATAARYFFNSGGQIRFTSSRVGGVTSGQNTAWTNLLSAISSINGGVGPRFGGAMPATGTEPNDGQNYYRLTNSYAAWYTASDSSPYGNNYFRIFARSPNVGDNSNGTDSQVQFLIYWVDGYVDPGTAPVAPDGYKPPTSAYPPDDLVDGTLTLAVSTLYATGTLLPAGAPAFVVENPNVTIGAISS